MKRVIAKIILAPTEEGGRRTPISAATYGCAVFFEGVPALSTHGYDCRMSVGELGRAISPGDTVDEIAMVFLSPDEVLPHMKPGVTFTLWEGKTIGRGTVLRVEDAT
jgi:hypothetical protein